MPRQMLGRVSDGERDDIRRIHERRTALQELLLTLDSPDLSPAQRQVLQTGIEEDLARTTARFEGWWQTVGVKYHLDRAGHGGWMLDFETQEIWHEPSTGQDCPGCALIQKGERNEPPADQGAGE